MRSVTKISDNEDLRFKTGCQRKHGVFFRKTEERIEKYRILLWPDFYFGNEWGCVNKKISISIPFYLSTSELRALEGDVPTNEEMMENSAA